MLVNLLAETLRCGYCGEKQESYDSGVDTMKRENQGKKKYVRRIPISGFAAPGKDSTSKKETAQAIGELLG